jgi:hypothetical protein
MVVMLPSALIAFFKVYQYLVLKNDFEKSTLNKSLSNLFKILNFYALIYYAVDMICYIALGKIVMICYKGFFLHHMASFIGLYFAYCKDLYWFEMLIGAGHAMNLTFPKIKILQYVYVGYMFLSNVMLFIKPYSGNKYVKLTRYCYPFAYIAFFILLRNNCLGMMDTTNIKI